MEPTSSWLERLSGVPVFCHILPCLPTELKSLPSEGKPHSCFLLTAVRLVSKELVLDCQPCPFQERVLELQDPPTHAPPVTWESRPGFSKRKPWLPAFSFPLQKRVGLSTLRPYPLPGRVPTGPASTLTVAKELCCCGYESARPYGFQACIPKTQER